MTTDVMGKTEPRLFTPPLVELTPETSRGFAVIEFAEQIGVELLPWQKWLLIHALELSEGDRPDAAAHYRFRTVLLCISRQNGKTTVAEILTLWRMVHEDGCMVLGTSVAAELAREPWTRVGDRAEDLGLMHRRTTGSVDVSLWLHNRSRYKVGISGRRGGRSLSVDLLLIDELREHLDWDGWNALTATTTARPDPQTWALSNAGDDRSVVLNALRDSALSGEDPALAVFEWSGFEGCELDDPEALAQANPALGYTISGSTLTTKRSTLPVNGYRTEHLCQRVEADDPAIDKQAWNECADQMGTMDGLRSRVVLGFDVSPDLAHASLVAAAVSDDGRVRVETVKAWESTSAARRELPELVGRIKPRAFVWFSSGPAAAMAPDLREIRRSVELTAETPGICQAVSEQITARRLVHSADPMLTAQVLGSSRTVSGDGWRFTRKGVGHCDAVYAMAGAVHHARSRGSGGRPRILLPQS